MRMTITTPTLPPTMSPTNRPDWVVLLVMPCELDLLEGSPISALVVETDVSAKVAVFAGVPTCIVELFAVGLIEEFT